MTGGLYGLYLQHEWHILPNVTVNHGARFDVADEYSHENQVSPCVHVVRQPTATTTMQPGCARTLIPPPFDLAGGNTVSRFNGGGLRAEGRVANGRALAGYHTINIAALQSFRSGPWRGTQLHPQVINLLDRDHEIRDGTGIGVGVSRYGRRRTIPGGIAERF